MKIAIFGDSFGDDHVNWKDKNRWLDVGPSWIDYLKQFHQIDNFCHGGSSLYYSKRKFDNTDLSVYDKVIFLTTDPMRRFQIWPGDTIEHGSNWNFQTVEYQLKNNMNPVITQQLVAMDLYFKYIYNESDSHFHQLMIDDIKRKCPTAFIINVAVGSVIGNVQTSENKYFTGLPYCPEGYMDARKCHMCEENNLILGKYIHHCVSNNIYSEPPLDMFTKPTRSFEHYFRKN